MLNKEEEHANLMKLYPLHYFVFNNDVEILKSELAKSGELKECINKLDIHGRSPIMLATILGHIECAKILLENGADANTQNKQMWSLSHEATLLKNGDFLRRVLAARDLSRVLEANKILKQIGASFKDSPDFYVEMTWEFTSWLPFVKNMCPSDTYKIYKHKNSIRIDANILEISPEHNSIKKRGDQYFIFRFNGDNCAEFIFVDRNERTAYMQNMDLDVEPKIEDFTPSDSIITQKLKSPISVTFIEVENIGFEPSKKNSRLFSWIGSSEKEEDVEGHTCRVFSATNVDVVTKTCFSHLDEEQREEAAKENTNKSIGLLVGLFEKKRVDVGCGANEEMQLDVVNYLTKPSESGKANIGKPRDEHLKWNSFSASLWLAESFPLNLREQIFHVIDLLAVRNAKFLRLKRFIQLQMPAGFPVRIKIPIFHLINAQITFHNVNEPDAEAIAHGEDEECELFRLKESLFQIPDGYEKYTMSGNLFFNRMNENDYSRAAGREIPFNTIDVGEEDEDNEYVYLLENFVDNNNDNNSSSPKASSYERQLQRAIEESLEASTSSSSQLHSADSPLNIKKLEENNEVDDVELLKALEISKKEAELNILEEEEEEKQYRAALERSMLDN